MDYNKLYEKREVVLAEPEEILLPALPEGADIKERALAVEKDIFATYYRLMMDDTISASTRKACADALADRARGKAVQAVEVNQRVQQLMQTRIEVVLVGGNAPVTLEG